VAGGDRGLARCAAAAMLVSRGRCEGARAERSCVGRLRPGRRASPTAGLPGGVRTGGGQRLWGAGDHGRMRGGLPRCGGSSGGERAAGRTRPDALVGGRARRVGPARAGAGASRGSRDRSLHGRGTARGAVASACGRSGATTIVVSSRCRARESGMFPVKRGRRDRAGERIVSRETSSGSHERPGRDVRFAACSP
jgi:hypothetical protein